MVAVADKVALQREMLADVAPELIGEFDRMAKVLSSLGVAYEQLDSDTGIARQYNVSPYTQGRVDAGSEALRLFRVVKP